MAHYTQILPGFIGFLILSALIQSDDPLSPPQIAERINKAKLSLDKNAKEVGSRAFQNQLKHLAQQQLTTFPVEKKITTTPLGIEVFDFNKNMINMQFGDQP